VVAVGCCATDGTTGKDASETMMAVDEVTSVAARVAEAEDVDVDELLGG
jgi:Ni,Fe-hydrogenase III small subunit